MDTPPSPSSPPPSSPPPSAPSSCPRPEIEMEVIREFETVNSAIEVDDAMLEMEQWFQGIRLSGGEVQDIIKIDNDEGMTDMEELVREEMEEEVKVFTRDNAQEPIIQEFETEQELHEHLLREFNDRGKDMKFEWLGTSSYYMEAGIKMQLEGQLDGVIAYREALVKDRNMRPYHPNIYIELAIVDVKLGFCDIAAGEAYRALVLAQSGLGTYKRNAYPTNLRKLVRDTVAQTSGGNTYPGDFIIDDDLEYLQLYAYKAILASLVGCAAFHEGCLYAKSALQKYPDDAELHALQQDLQSSLEERVQGLEENETTEQRVISYMTKTGRVYQKKYPWMEKTLFYRTSDLVRDINKADKTANWKIKPVMFGPPSERPKVEDGGDVGPLGLFAKRTIQQGKLIMIDHTLAGISSIPTSRGLQCDACHAALVYPYIRPEHILHPQCCDEVSFCSKKCHENALHGYHKMTCGRNLEWVSTHHEEASEEGRSNWRPKMFLRLMAIVLADGGNNRILGEQHSNPLKHPLIAMMTGNYKSLKPGDLKQATYDWQFWENVVAPLRILMEMNVDVFAEEVYSQEVIQTLYWRFENNANQAATAIIGPHVEMKAVNPNYLFLNHSCDPNVSWHGSVPGGEVDVECLMDRDGTILQPGSCAIWCIAGKHIKKGEELKISYIGNPQGIPGKKGEDRASKRVCLDKWFDNGCGCALCEKENAERFFAETANGDDGSM